MGCNCKAQQQIDALFGKYGVPVNADRTEELRQELQIFLSNVLIYILLIPLAPIILLYVIYVSFFKKHSVFNIKELMKFL